MDIVKLKLKDLEQNTGQIEGLPTNPRQWTRADIDRLAESLKDTPELFEARPIIVVRHGKKYVILGGNLRYEGSKVIGLTEVPCVVMPEGMPLEKLKEIVIKDNGSFGAWDYDLLANEWDDLPLTEWGVPAWDAEDEGKDVEANTATEDDFDETQDAIEVKCKPGDVWELGEHRLMCGDSIQLADVQKLMGGGTADLLLTDPPYNVNYEGGTKDKLKIENDNMTSDRFGQFLQDAFQAASNSMKPGASYYIWHADNEGVNFRKACEGQIGKIRECLIWNKNSLVIGRQDYQWKHEPCLYGWKDGAAHYFFDSRSETTVIEDTKQDFNKMKASEMRTLLRDIFSAKKATTVIDCDRPSVSEEHPTMKPVKLFGYLIRNSSKPGEIVLDTFGGSGTTLIACEQLGRKARLMELDPHYCDVIIARWEKLTGQKAKLCSQSS